MQPRMYRHACWDCAQNVQVCIQISWDCAQAPQPQRGVWICTLPHVIYRREMHYNGSHLYIVIRCIQVYRALHMCLDDSIARIDTWCSSKTLVLFVRHSLSGVKVFYRCRTSTVSKRLVMGLGDGLGGVLETSWEFLGGFVAAFIPGVLKSLEKAGYGGF